MSGKKKPKVTLSAAQREELIRDNKADESYKNSLTRDARPGEIGAMTSERGEVNTELIDARVARRNQVLVEGSVERSTKNRAELESERAKLAKDISDMALTRTQMRYKGSDGYEYHKAVRKSKAQEAGNPRFAELCERFRTISRQLEPDDPEFSSIERLRKP